MRESEDETDRPMSKKLMSTVLLFLIGVGFAFFSFYQFTTGSVGLGLLYLIPTLAAFGALVMLPFRAAP